MLVLWLSGLPVAESDLFQPLFRYKDHYFMPKLISKIWVHVFMLLAMLMATISVDSIASNNIVASQHLSTPSNSISPLQPIAQANIEHHCCCGSVCLLKMPSLIMVSMRRSLTRHTTALRLTQCRNALINNLMQAR